MEIIDRIENLWQELDIAGSIKPTLSNLQEFKDKYGVILPEDIVQYLLILNGTSDKCDDNLFRFYSLEEILPVEQATSESMGIPRHKYISKTLPAYKDCFVFADHSFSVYLYAIILNKSIVNNKVYIIHGGNYEVIANSFTEFLELYLRNDRLMYI